MWNIAKPAVLGFGVLVAGAIGAQAQVAYYPGGYRWDYWSNRYVYTYPSYGYTSYGYPSYDYTYGYPTYYNTYGYPASSYWYGWPYYGYSYPQPRAYWDPYVWYRPYSDNAGPRASTTGGGAF